MASDEPYAINASLIKSKMIISKFRDMNILKKIFGGTDTADFKSIINDGAFLVDVRTAEEFAAGNVKGSVNIPLDSIASQLSQFSNKKTIVVFCRSGVRSNQAKSILEKNGFTNVINAGTWQQVNKFV